MAEPKPRSESRWLWAIPILLALGWVARNDETSDRAATSDIEAIEKASSDPEHLLRVYPYLDRNKAIEIASIREGAERTRRLAIESQKFDAALAMEMDRGERLKAQTDQMIREISTPRTFHGYVCLSDCSGHKAGFEWARQNGIGSTDRCGGNSQSFTEGCWAFVNQAGL